MSDEPPYEEADGASPEADEDERPSADAGEPADDETAVESTGDPQVEASDADGAEADAADDTGANDVEESGVTDEPDRQYVEHPATDQPRREYVEHPAAGEGAVDRVARAIEPPESERESDGTESVPPDVQKYERFKKVDGAQYDRVNEFLRERTYVTAREWAIARLCADFRTETGVEMTKIGENLPRLVPFMTDTYTPQAVNQARSSFEDKVKKSGSTFLYGAMSGFFTAEELDEMMYEVTEVAKFLLEVEGVDLSVDEELEAEDRISTVMREVRQSSAELRAEEVECPNCGHVHEV